MWILMDTGFLSIVQHNKNKNRLLVRARVEGDIKEFARLYKELFNKKLKIDEVVEADYRWRTTAERGKVAELLMTKIMELDYTSHVKDVAIKRSAPNTARSAAYYATWDAMNMMQEAEHPFMQRRVPMRSGSKLWGDLGDTDDYDRYLFEQDRRWFDD